VKVKGKHYRSIWLNEDGWRVDIIDQTRLPHEFEIVTLETVEDAARAIEVMQVRGAPLIGATAAYGMCLALREDARSDGQHPHPLQCRLAGHGRLGHRAGPHLHGPRRGIPVHVWADETRPRNQGAA
jgi:methylthioribose-1-phosphate isomerase